jgi:hypothetical protein
MHATGGAPANTGSAVVIDNYDLFREGDFEPYLGKTIVTLVYKDQHCIVYLDEDTCVEWVFTGSYRHEWKSNPDFSRVLSRVTDVQAYPVSHLSQDQLSTFRQLVAEALARLLKDNKPAAANEALDTAVRWVQARNREIARWWYLCASLVTSGVFAIALLVLWLLRAPVSGYVGRTAFEVILGGGAGAVGALLFILARSKSIRFDPSAAKRIHRFEGIARVLVGGIGAVLAALAVEGGVVFAPFSAPTASHLGALLAVCMVAGASERLVPSFIEKVNFKDPDDAGDKSTETDGS